MIPGKNVHDVAVERFRHESKLEGQSLGNRELRCEDLQKVGVRVGLAPKVHSVCRGSHKGHLVVEGKINKHICVC